MHLIDQKVFMVSETRGEEGDSRIAEKKSKKKRMR